MKFIKDNPEMAGVALLVVVAALWIASRGAKQAGADVAGGAVNLLWGAGTGAAAAVVDNASNPASNPLYNFGSAVGADIFKATHGSTSGGWW